MNARPKLLIDQLSSLFNQLVAQLEQIGHTTNQYDSTKQQFQAHMQALQTIDQQLDKGAAKLHRMEEALEALNQELKDVIYMTSHDFREPLRKIASFGAILRESLEGKIGQEDQENLDFMIDGAERMTQMIEDLLAYSRINTKIIAIEKVNLNDVVEHLEKLDLAKLLEDTGAQIQIPEPLPSVQGDPVLIRQLLRNLIIHAIKHRKEDVHLRIVMRSERTTADEVIIVCEDNGVGTETKNNEDMFKMSLHSHSRQEYEEAGTGLAACKKIVDRHGGRIGIESKAGVGITIWFTLPVSKHLEPEQGELLGHQTDPQGLI